MSYPSIEKIAEEVKAWDCIVNLPQEMYGFVKQTDGNIDGQEIILRNVSFSDSVFTIIKTYWLFISGYGKNSIKMFECKFWNLNVFCKFIHFKFLLLYFLHLN